MPEEYWFFYLSLWPHFMYHQYGTYFYHSQVDNHLSKNISNYITTLLTKKVDASCCHSIKHIFFTRKYKIFVIRSSFSDSMQSSDPHHIQSMFLPQNIIVKNPCLPTLSLLFLKSPLSFLFSHYPIHHSRFSWDSFSPEDLFL